MWGKRKLSSFLIKWARKKVLELSDDGGCVLWSAAAWVVRTRARGLI